MNSHTIEDLTSCVLDFQGNMARVIYRKKTTLVEPDVEETHAASLDYIWTNSSLQVETASDGTLKWRQLGFASENLSHEFNETGVLGLDCLVSLFRHLKRVSAVDTSLHRNTSSSAIQTFSPKLYRNRTPGRHSDGVQSLERPTRSSSSYQSTGVFWLPDVRSPR
jgi:hypothetical protein